MQSANTDSIVNPPSHIRYVQNKGQWQSPILYEGKFRGGKVFLEKNRFTFLLYPATGLKADHHNISNELGNLSFHAFNMMFVNSLVPTSISEKDTLSFYENFILGNDSSKWASQVKSFKQITYHNLYKNIDVKTFSQKNNVRFDYILHPNSSITDIKMEFKGADRLSIKEGRLIINTSVGEVYLTRPISYQLIDGKKQFVACEYVLSKKELTFKILGAYDKSKDLIIDPTLVFATYTGSTSDNFGMTATYDNAGNGYTAGICYGIGYPTTVGAFQPNYNSFGSNPIDISISKFNSSGTTLLFSTYLGGNSEEKPESIVVDHNNNLVIIGNASSANFPITTGAFQPARAGSYDIIISKLNSTGTSLLASTYLGGTLSDGKNLIPFNYEDELRSSVIVDASNNIYIGSNTSSSSFPVTVGCLQPTISGPQDGIIAKFNPQLTTLFYCTFLGGSSRDAIYSITLNENEDLFVCGGTESANFPTTAGTYHTTFQGVKDGFIAHINSSGNALVASTYIGTNAYDQSFYIQTDKQNKVYVYGQTAGAYPVSAGVYSNPSSGQFIHCLNSSLTTTQFSTVFGNGLGHPNIVPTAFLIDVCGNIYASGWGSDLFMAGGLITTNGMPTTSNAFMQNTDGNDFYFFVLNPNALSLQYATFFGGSQSTEHVDGGSSRFDKNGTIYQAICESCGGNDDMPTTPSAYSSTNNSSNCNNALVKFSFAPNITIANLNKQPVQGCAPLAITFTNTSVNGNDYKWDFGDGGISIQTTPVHTYTNVGTYTVQLISHNANTCNVYDTAYTTVKIFPSLNANITPNYTICLKDTAVLNLTTPINCTYTWSPSGFLNNAFIQKPKAFPNTDTKYSVTINNGGCSIKDSVVIHISKNDTKIQVGSISACLEDSLLLKTDQTNPIYNWSNGSNTQSTYIYTAGWYYLTTQNNDGCPAKDSIQIIASNKIPLTPFSSTICLNQLLQLFAPANYTYQWVPNYQINNSTVFNPIVNPLITTVYFLTLINGPCVTSTTYSIYVNSLPTLTVTPAISEIYPGDDVILFIHSTDSCLGWYPPIDISCMTCTQTIASPNNSIYYSQTVINKYGCTQKDSALVKVIPTLYIPNSFSPNDDNVNDIFKPEYAGYEEVELLIFDRWGVQLFRTTELQTGWNGKYKDNPCQIGVYIYKLRAKDINNKTIRQVGHVTLLR